MFSKVSAPQAQTPIQRKAFAIADSLEPFHWDNCKVRFARHTSRAYVEEALRDGHDEARVIGAYRAALGYCHGCATDEINRSVRHQHDKASPALTVWLAARKLAHDGRTTHQRWALIWPRLEARRQKTVLNEAQANAEIARLAPEITAWFAAQVKTVAPVIAS